MELLREKDYKTEINWDEWMKKHHIKLKPIQKEVSGNAKKSKS